MHPISIVVAGVAFGHFQPLKIGVDQDAFQIIRFPVIKVTRFANFFLTPNRTVSLFHSKGKNSTTIQRFINLFNDKRRFFGRKVKQDCVSKNHIVAVSKIICQKIEHPGVEALFLQQLHKIWYCITAFNMETFLPNILSITAKTTSNFQYPAIFGDKTQRCIDPRLNYFVNGRRAGNIFLCLLLVALQRQVIIVLSAIHKDIISSDGQKGMRDSNQNNRGDIRQKQEKLPKSEHSTSVVLTWLELVNLFQTFEDLESVKDKEADTQAVRRLIDEDTAIAADEEVVC